MVDNLHAFDLETMAQILLAFNDSSTEEIGKIPIQGVEMKFKSPHQKLMASFEERLASRGQGEYLSAESTICLFVQLQQF
jgi:hypothetical protein